MRSGLRTRSARPALLSGLALLAALGWSPSGTLAQTTTETGTGLVWQSYSFGDGAAVGVEDVTLLTIPVAFAARFGSTTALDVRGAWASGRLTAPGGAVSTISGPTDLEVTLSRTFGLDAVVASLVGFLPTGASTQTLEESAVAGAVAGDLLPFRISNWGTGGGVGGSLAVARRVSGFGVGASVGYVVAREYEPVTGDVTVFQPGDFFRMNVVADRTVGGRSKFSLRMGFQRFGDDGLDGVDLFRSGNRYDAMVSYAFPSGRNSSAIVYGGFLQREEGRYLADPREVASQGLLLAGGALRAPLAGGVLTPSVDLRLLRRGDGVGQGYLGGIGAGFELPTQGATLIPSVRVRRGSVEARQGLESSVTGIEAALAVRFGRVRR
jgi:hypothetical protein